MHPLEKRRLVTAHVVSGLLVDPVKQVAVRVVYLLKDPSFVARSMGETVPLHAVDRREAAGFFLHRPTVHWTSASLLEQAGLEPLVPLPRAASWPRGATPNA